MTRSRLAEIAVVVLAILIGYVGVTFAQRDVLPPTPTPSVRPEAPTATVAPAMTFTPSPTAVPTRETPTIVSIEPTASATPSATPTSRPATKTPSPTPTPIVYVVQPGDSLDGIGRKFGVSTDAILRANNLSDPNSLAQGQKLLIPRK